MTVNIRLILGNQQEPVVGEFIYFLSELFELEAVVRQMCTDWLVLTSSTGL